MTESEPEQCPLPLYSSSFPTASSPVQPISTSISSDILSINLECPSPAKKRKKQISNQECPFPVGKNQVEHEFTLTKKQITAAINNPNPEFTMKRALIMKEYMPKDVEPLPNDWIEVKHKSHMNLYFHKTTQVVTWSRPYFIGKAKIRNHEVPLTSIPCLLKKRLDEKRIEAENLTKENVNAVLDCTTDSMTPEQFQSYLKKRFEFEEVEKRMYKEWLPHKFNRKRLMQVRKTRKNQLKEQKRLQNLSENQSPQLLNISDTESDMSTADSTLEEGEINSEPDHEIENDTQSDGLEEGEIVSSDEEEKLAKKQTEANIKPDKLPSLMAKTIRVNFKNPTTGKVEVWTTNGNKTSLAILSDYCQKVYKRAFEYVESTERASNKEPWKTTIKLPDDKLYGTGLGVRKRLSKERAIVNTLKMLIPGYEPLDSHLEHDPAVIKNEDFFNHMEIDDPKAMEYLQKANLPLPTHFLDKALMRQHSSTRGKSSVQVEYTLITHEKAPVFRRIEMKAKLGKHECSGFGDNQKIAKQRAACMLIKRIHVAQKNTEMG